MITAIQMTMTMIIHTVANDSPAQQAGLQPGDIILSLNGRQDLEDMFDYQFEVTDEETVTVVFQRGERTSETTVIIDKAPDEDFGLTFTSPVFTPIKTCNNACPFCFIDQQPQGLRPSLYVKDDDWRLSYFTNTYITLTNLTDRDRQRIKQIRPGPLYVSVHSTVPEIRVQMLNNPKFAGNIMSELRWLQSLEVPFHCQMVICPGINDGPSVTTSLTDLYSLRQEALSVAVIPVGLTEHRAHLPALTPVDAASAAGVIAQVEAFWQQHPDAKDFVFLSDEFYFKAGLPLPQYETYGDFPQLDDGVGTSRMLMEDFFALTPTLPKAIDTPKNVLILTGKLAAMTLFPIVQRLNEIEGLYIDCLAVESHFWGEAVDVAGLITGQDIQATLSQQAVSGYAFALIPSVMLKEDSDLFLDGTRIGDLETQFELPFTVVQNPYSAKELVEKLQLTPSTPLHQ